MDNTRDRPFHFFPQLPTELRLAIWRECLSPRVVELDNSWDEGAYPDLKFPPCTLRRTTGINRCPPAISRVCRESRQVALETYHIRDRGSPPEHAKWSSNLELGNLWIDPSRDSVHLNWMPHFEPSYWSDGSALDYLAWNAVQAQGGSFMLDYLEDTFDGDVHMEDRIGALQQLRHGGVVMRIIVVHTAIENAARTGLFGFLGDAPIQLVDVSDESRLAAFYDLAMKCESEAKGFITRRQDFRRDSPESIEKTLKDRLADTFGAEAAQTLPAMRPVIMFRFCPRWCNHSLGHVERAREKAKASVSKRGYLQRGIRDDVRFFEQSFHMR